MPRLINPTPQFSDGAGDPLVSGKLYVFESNTDTAKATFADVNLKIQNPHPIVLTGSGSAPNIFFNGSARVKLTDSDDVQIWDKDPVSSDEVGANFDDWNPLFIYNTNNIVVGSDGNYYKSFTDGNENNDPTSSPAFWEQVEFIRIWNTNVTYDIGDTVKASDNNFYKGLTASNQGNDPVSSPANWGAPFTSLNTVVGGEGISVDDADPVNPIINYDIDKQPAGTVASSDTLLAKDIDDTNAIIEVTAQSVANLLAAASETVQGKVELLTQTELNTGTDTTRAPTAATIAGSNFVNAPNLIKNGGFQSNQGVYVSGTATAAGALMHDNWRSGSTDSSYTFTVAAPSSPQTVTIAANDSIEQVIEGADIETAGTHTISWDGTATARAVVNTQTMSGNFAVSPITVTAVLDQVITIQFTGADAAGGSTEATDTGALGKVRCRLGLASTAFLQEDAGTILSKAQRTFKQFGPYADTNTAIATGQCTSATSVNIFVKFGTTMRVLPTSIEVNSVSGFIVRNAAGGAVATTNLVFGKAHPDGVSLVATVASGLVAGDSTELAVNTANTDFLAITGAAL